MFCDGGSSPTAEDDGLAWIDEDASTEAVEPVAEDGDLGTSFGLDGINDFEILDDETAEILRDAEPNSGEASDDANKRLCEAYRRLYTKHGQRMALKNLRNTMMPLSRLIAWIACKSLSQYTTMRTIVQFAARKPFSYTDCASGEWREVETFLCARLIVAVYSDASPDIFKWSKLKFLEDPDNQELVDQTVRDWKEAVFDHFAFHELAPPVHIALISDTRHCRGNNFLLVFRAVDHAVSARSDSLEIGDCLLRITAVVNRRMRLRLGGGLVMPDLLSTAAQASLAAKDETADLFDYLIDNVSPYEYLCEGGIRVMQEKAVRVLHCDPALTADMVAQYFVETAGVRPARVLRDSKFKQTQPGFVTWIADFAQSGADCEDQFRDIDEVMRQNNGTFLHPTLGEHAIRLQLLRKRTPGGRASKPWKMLERIQETAANRRNLLELHPARPAHASILEFWDGFAALKNSMTNFRYTILSADLYKAAKSTAGRGFDVRSSEGQAPRAPLTAAKALEEGGGLPSPILIRRATLFAAFSAAPDTVALGKILEGKLGDSNLRIICAPMHTVMRTLKIHLSLIQSVGIGTAPDGPGAKESLDIYAMNQKALINSHLLMKDESNPGDRISMDLNGESIRLVFNRWPDLVGEFLSRVQALLPILATWTTKLIYSHELPTARSRLALWCLTYAEITVARIMDDQLRATQTKDRKNVVVCNHAHVKVAHLPQLHEAFDVPLIDLSEEAGERLQKPNKESMYNRSDRKTDQVDTMIREEFYREKGMIEYGMRITDPHTGQPKHHNAFQETVETNVIYYGCFYNFDQPARFNFVSLLGNLAMGPSDLLADQAYIYLRDQSPIESTESPVAQMNLLQLPPKKPCKCTCLCQCVQGCAKAWPCRCKCRDDCRDCAHGKATADCSCLSYPLVVLLTGKGAGTDQYLHVRFCESGDQTTCSAHIPALVSYLRGSNALPSPGRLIPAKDYILGQLATLCNAAARRFRQRNLVKLGLEARARLAERVTFDFNEPITGPPHGGTLVTIRGRGFGTLCTAEGGRISVRVGDTLATDVTILDDTSITIVTLPGTGGDRPVVIIPPVFVRLHPGDEAGHLLAGQRIELATRFSFGGPTVHPLPPDVRIPTEGGPLCVTGTNLDDPDCLISAVVHDRRGAIVADPEPIDVQVAVATIGGIRLHIGPGPGSLRKLELRNKHGTTYFRMSYQGPEVTAVEEGRELGTVGGARLTLEGRNFGRHGDIEHVTIGTDRCRFNLLEDHRKLQVTVPSSSGGRMPIQVTVRGARSPVRDNIFVQYAAPVVISCTPSAKPGDVISVTGRHLGSTIDQNCQVTIGGILCDYARVTLAHVKLDCRVPEGEGRNHSVLVCISGQWSAPSTAVFAYKEKPKQGSAKRPQLGAELPVVFSEAEITGACRVNVQYRLMRYYADYKDERARMDAFGQPFDKRSQVKAQENHDKVLDRLVKVEKPARSDIWASMRHAWEQEKARRGLLQRDKEAPSSSKRQRKE
ncbi:hypothetical protein KFL_002400050 [Klebsormidium nitens]|uniref:IPT/TIG domain-containing protein n=1 Tax=Klebsormidium nitens TaxID=105231 RepID=A0A1Y1I4W2_KLENI|nr:hypothetical protein KFL_002400050 [Klebsormidium nitens]|eukprot:GAQ85533.1 hypothetical protein KFL_002400050 [Klebsormidium nitens]